ncbi:MAG: type III PLP-dependent enzyme [Planctomycetota bacterium]
MAILKGFVEKCIHDFGTPFYLYDLSEIDKRIDELTGALPSGASLMYSIKANPFPGIIRALVSRGLGLEVSSSGEVEAASQFGSEWKKCLFTGPGKTRKDIACALRHGISHFSCESWTELDRVASEAASAGVRPNVILRVNPMHRARSHIRMAGAGTHFGFPLPDLIHDYRIRMACYSGVNVIGVHMYLGSQMIDADEVIASVKLALSISDQLSHLCGVPLKIIDVGGGFPWPFGSDTGKLLDLSRLHVGLAETIDKCGLPSEADLWFESGRYLTASSGTLVCTVLDIRSIEDKIYVVLDAGINNLGGMTGVGRALTQKLAVLPLRDCDGQEAVEVDFMGPLCTPLDCLSRGIAVQSLSVGDRVMIPNVGAYGLTASLVSFLSRSAPFEIAHRQQQICSVSRLESGYQAVSTACS